jgi:hypothetical protein
MRRRLSLAMVAVLIVLAVLASRHYLSLRTRSADRIASTSAARDSLGRVDSAARADARQDPDTMCFASRIGLSCDPR